METLITLGKDVLNRFEKSAVVYKSICKKWKVTYGVIRTQGFQKIDFFKFKFRNIDIFKL